MKYFSKDSGGSFVMGTGERKFFPGQFVLVRGGGPESIDPRVWRVGVFSFQRAVPDGGVGFFTGTGVYCECIPLEGNESFVGSARPFGDSPPKGRPAVVRFPVTETAAIGSEVDDLRAKLRERDSRIEELKSDVCKVTAEKSVLLERYRDSESIRRGLEDRIVTLLTQEDPSAGNFLQCIVAENRVYREERGKLLEERDKLLATIEELRTGMRKYAAN